MRKGTWSISGTMERDRIGLLQRPDFESPLCDGLPRQPLHEKGETGSGKDLQEIHFLNTALEDGLVLE